MGSFEGCSTEEEKFIAGQGDLKLLLATQDKQKCDALIRLLAQSHTWQVPTLAWQRGGTFLDQRDLKHDPLDKYVPAYWRDVTWKRFTEEMMPGLLHDPLELRQKYFAGNLQMVGAMQRANHLQIASEIFLAQLQRIVQQPRHHFLGESFPSDIAPVRRDVLVERIVLQVALVEKSAAALPCERGNLPGVALRQQTNERIALLFVLRREHEF